MADGGSIAKYPGALVPTMPVQLHPVLPVTHRCIRTVSAEPSVECLALNAGRDDTEGSASAPSLQLPKGGVIRFRIPIAAGSRSVTIKAKQPSATLPRPSARLIANADIGLDADVSASAPAGSDWVLIGPLTFTATNKGGVMIELFAPWSGGESGCWFDSLTVT